jgi:NAD(P)-dependent dehydrogenase (short-subunit alcohol dehydrogenase family)
MYNPFTLENKKILVTGASSGIGKETAISISKMGGKVIITGRDKARLENTFRELQGEGHQQFLCDLTNETEMEALVNAIASLNGIVHSAGVVKSFPIKFITRKQIDEMYNLNYISSVLLTSKLLKDKKVEKGASIVFMSSISSHYPHKGIALYAGSKAGIESYSKVIALEHAAQQIRSNCINAAMVKTPLFDEAEKMISKELMDEHGSHYPLGFGNTTDIANTTIFLLSDASRWITGTNIVMDGGLTAGQ